MKRTTSVLAAAACATAPLLAIAAPAEASTRWQLRSSGAFAQVDWIERGQLNGVNGNVHLGNLRVEGDRTAMAFGVITDWTCPEGELPEGGGHGEPPAEGGCQLESERFLFGDGVTLSVDRKLTSARLTGTLTVENHGGEGNVATPPVDITWTGNGGTSTSTFQDSYTDGNGAKYLTKRTEVWRGADVTGSIGTMGFADDADDESFGSLGTFKVLERGVTP